MVGDEVVITEESYQRIIGAQAASLDLYARRITVKDEAIKAVTAENLALRKTLEAFEVKGKK